MITASPQQYHFLDIQPPWLIEEMLGCFIIVQPLQVKDLHD